MIREISKAMNIREGHQPELEDLAKDIAPEQLLEAIDKHEQNVREGRED